MKTIFLCGFMGCGKSTVGSLLAKKAGRAFVDMDTYIEKREGMSIPEIFEKKGEEYFRAAEKEALRELGESSAVVATGGGALLSDENAEIARTSGVVFYIDTPFDICYERIKDDSNRPIAFNSTRQQLLDRFEYRKPLYIKNSDHTADGSKTPIEIAAEIIKNAV